jgi:hypothetical protein
MSENLRSSDDGALAFGTPSSCGSRVRELMTRGPRTRLFHETIRALLVRDTRSPAPGLARRNGNGFGKSGTDTAILDGITEETGCQPCERSLGRLRPDPPRARLALSASRSVFWLRVLKDTCPKVSDARTCHGPVADHTIGSQSGEVKFPRADEAKRFVRNYCDATKIFSRCCKAWRAGNLSSR